MEAGEGVSIAIILEGRIVGPWATCALPRRAQAINRSMHATYTDATGLLILRDIYCETSAEIITASPWTK
jgi:hypothetical protein